MKVSTILKAVVAVAAIGGIGAAVCSKTKAEKEIKMAENIEAEEEADNKKVKNNASKIITKENIDAVLGGVCCGLAGGLLTYTIMVPLTHKIADHVVVYKLVQKAIENNNLSVEELINLAYETNQEVA